MVHGITGGEDPAMLVRGSGVRLKVIRTICFNTRQDLSGKTLITLFVSNSNIFTQVAITLSDIL